MDADSDEYKQLMEECDRIKTEYDIHHNNVIALHNEWREEVRRTSHTTNLKIENLDVLCHRLMDISGSIINEIEIQRTSL